MILRTIYLKSHTRKESMAKKILKTGETAEVSGLYAHAGNPDGKTSCTPTKEEQIIPLEKGETAPPVKSCAEPAMWKLVKTT